MFLDRHYQNAYVTVDAEAAARRLVREFGLPEPKIIDARKHMAMPEGKGLVEMKIVFVQVGPLQYELIEPIAGPVSLYRDFLPDDGSMRLHHIAMRCDDIGPVCEASEKLGRRVVFTGQAWGVDFCYIDARDTFGHYLEYVSGQSRLTKGMNGGAA